MNQLHSELKKEFQLERMILFSDAVFAIAITLLALEIKVPELNRDTATDAQLRHALVELIPKIVGFLVSFFIIGLYWTIHHRMFGFVVNYTRKMLWLNLFFLLAVVLMPFSTAFYSVYLLRLLKIPVIIYAANITFLGIMNFILWSHISNPKLSLSEGLSADARKYFMFRAILIPVIFVAMTLVYLFIAPKFAIWIPPFIPVIMRIIRWRFKKKMARNNLHAS